LVAHLYRGIRVLRPAQRRLLLLSAAFALSLLSCGREVTGPDDGIQTGRSRFAALALDPRMPDLMASLEGASEAVPFEDVRVVLRREDGTIVIDTVIAFPAGEDTLAVTLLVPIPLSAAAEGLPLSLTMAYINAAGDTVFRGGPEAIVARPIGTPGADAPVELQIVYDGVGKDAAAVVITTVAPDTVTAGTSSAFIAEARDGLGSVIAGTPLFWYTLDSSRAAIPNAGVSTVTWGPARGTARVVAALPNNLRADTIAVYVKLPPSKLVVGSGGAQAGVVHEPLAQPIVVRTLASDDVPVGGVIVNFAVATGGGTLTALSDTSDANGDVSTSWTLGAAVGLQTITATAAGLLPSPLTIAATAGAGAPAQLAITAAPTAGVAGIALTPALVVAVEDTAGNVATSFTGNVTVALPAGSTATLGGTVTRAAVAGIATFDDLTLNRVGEHPLIVASDALVPDTTAAVSIAHGAATALVFSVPPAATGAGAVLAPALVVEARDASGNVATGFTGVVTMAIAAGTPGAVLGGTTARAAVGGIATFDDLTIDLPGLTYQLSASAGGLTPAVSGTFSVSSAGPTTIAMFSGDGQSATVNTQIAAPIYVRVSDAGDNPVENVTVLFSIAQGQAFLGTATVLTDVSGFAATDVVMGDIAGTILVHATVDGLAGSPVVFTLTATAGLPQSIEVVSGSAQTAVAGTPLADSAVVRVLDQYGNLVPGATVSFNTVTGASAFSDTTMLTDAAGRAAVQVTAGTVAGARNFSAAADGVVVPATFTVTITPAALAQFVLQSHPSAGTAGALLAPAFIVQPRDAFGNPRAVVTDSAILSIEEGPVGAILSGTLVRFSDAGLISFGDLSVDLVGNYRFRIEAEGIPAVVTPPFTEVVAGAADSLLLLDGDNQAAPAGGTLPQPMRVRVADALGNPVGGVMVSWAVTSGDVVLTAPTSVTDAAGVAVMGLTAGGTTGSVTVEASVGGLTGSPVGFLLAVAPGAPARLSAAGGIIINAGQTYPPNVVIALDAFGNPTAGLVGDVMVSVDSGPATGVLLGTTTVTPVSGIATFDDLRLEVAGSYRLRFQSAGLADTVVSGYGVLAGPAFTLAMLSGSAQTDTVGATIDSLRVRVTDAFGNPITGAGVTWDVTAGDASLSAALTATDTLGIAAVSLTFGATPGAVEVTATSGALSGSPQTFFLTAVSGAAGAMVVTSAPSPVPAATATEYAVEIRDSFGNVVTSFTDAVTVTIVTGPTSTFLGGTTIVNAVAGVATFPDLQFGAVGTYGIRFQATGLADVDATVVVEAGAPGSWSVISGDNQTGQATLPLDLPLAVLVLDGAGNPVVGDTVRFAVTSGGGTFPNGFATDTVLTDVDGIAAVEWFLGATLGAQSAQAEHATLTPLTFSATAEELVGNRVWTGDASTAVSDPANWKDGLVPTATDSVLVPAGRPNYPALAANLTVARLTVSEGAAVELGQWLLRVDGSVAAPVTGVTSSDTGAVVLQGATGGFVHGGFPRLVVSAGGYTTSGAVSTVTDLNLIGTGDLEPGAHPVTVGRDLTTAESATLTMMQTTSEITVNRHALFAGASTAGRLSDGVLRVANDFAASAPSAFQADVGHTVELTGLDASTISLFEADTTLSPVCSASCFGRLLGSKGPGDAGIAFLTAAKAVQQMDLTTATLNAAGQFLISGGTARLLGDVTTVRKIAWADGLERSASFAVDTLVAFGVGSVIPAGEVIPTIVAGDVRIDGTVLTTLILDGVLDVDGTAQITGSLLTRGNGRLRMTEGTDSLTVPNATFGGITDASYLTAGTLVVTFSFTQSGAGVTTYAAQDGTHRLRFSNPGFTHFLNVADAANNPIGSLSVSEGVEVSLGASNLAVLGTVTLDGTSATVNGSGGEAVLTGGLVDGVGGRWDVATTRFQGDGAVLPKVMDFDVRVAGAIALVDSLTVGGDLRATGPTGVLTLGGQYVTAQSFGTYEGGRLVMADAADTLRVAGAATFEGGTSSLIAGYLEIGGDFTQGVEATAFQAEPTHSTWFVGTTAQAITFANPGFGASDSYFGELYDAKPAGVILSFGSDVYVNGALETGIASGYSLSGSGQRIVSRGANVSDITFAGVHWEIVDGADIAPLVNVTFNIYDPTLTALRIARSGGAVSLVSTIFDQPPTTGYYLEAEDVLGDADVLTVTLSGTSPASSGGRVNTLGGAVIDGWPSSGTFVWTGALSSAWTNPGNWVQNAVPAAADSVYIPEGTVTMPAIDAATTVRALVSAATNPMAVNAVLTITERVQVPNVPGAITCLGAPVAELHLEAQADSILASGAMTCLVRVMTGRTALGGLFEPAGIQVEGTGVLAINEWTLVTSGLDVIGGGVLAMDRPTSLVTVLGNTQIATTGAPTVLTDGRLELHGNFLHTSGLVQASMPHVTAFAGTTDATFSSINMGPLGTDSYLAHVELAKTTGPAGVLLESDLWARGQLVALDGVSQEFEGVAAPRTVVSGGAGIDVLDAVAFRNARWEIREGAVVASPIRGVSFLNQPEGTTQFTLARTSGVVTLQEWFFDALPASTQYMSVEDTDGGAPGELTVTMATPSPIAHGGRIAALNGAVIDGWPAFSVFTWSGVTSTAWTDPSNWVQNAVPTPSDSVEIPEATPNLPTISAPTAVRVLRSLTSSPITLASELTVTDRLSLSSAPNSLTCPTGGEVRLVGGADSVVVSGGIACLVRASDGRVSLAGPVSADSLVIDGSGFLTVNEWTLAVAGEVRLTDAGEISMDQATSTVSVGGDLRFEGTGAQTFNAGRLELSGDLQHNGTLPVMFIVIALVGSEPQQIGAPTTGQPGFLQFDRLELSKSALALVTLTSSITLNGEFDVAATAAHHLVSDGSSRQIVARGGSAPAGAALTVDNISLYYIDGATLASDLHGFSFLNFPTDNFPLYFGRSSDAVTLHDFVFEDVVTAYGFLTIQDTDGAVPTPLTVTMVNPSPLFHGGRATADNGAVLLGWAAEPDFTWTGAADQAWANPLNWADNLVPAATDSATIPAGASVSPILDDEIVTLRALVNQSATVPLDLMGISQLTITERLVTDGAGDGLTCSPNSFLALTGTATATGRVGGCVVQAVGGTVVAQDSLVLGSSLILQNDAVFDVNDAVVRVAGEFEVLGTAVLTMDGVNDSLLVDSTAQFQGGPPVLTAGVLRIGGSFVQVGAGNFSASGAHETQLFDLCLGDCGIPVISFADTARASTYFHHLTILDGARDIQTPLTVNGDFRVETEAVVTSPEVARVTGGFFGSLNATITMPELELHGEFAYPGTFLLDTVRFAGALQRIPTIVAGQVREYTHMYVTGTAAAGNEGLPIDTLRLGGNLWITSGGSLNLEGAGDSLFVRIGSPGSTTRRNLTVLTGGLLSMQDPGVVVLVSGSAQFAGGDHTGLLTAGELRVESGFSGSTPNAFVASGDHRTRLGGNGLLDFYSVNVTEGALVRFGRLQLTPDLFTASGSFAADSLLMPDGGTLEMPVANTGLTVFGKVETSTTAALDVARLSIGGSLQYNGSTPIDTIVLTGNAQRLLAETDSAVSPVYNHLRVTGIVQTQIPDAGMLQVTGDLEVLESGSLEIGELGLSNYLEVLGALIVRGPVAQLSFADGQLFADSVHIESGGTSAPSSGTMISRSFVQVPFVTFHEAWRPTGTFENRLQGTGTLGFSLDGASFFNRLQFAPGSDMTLLSSVMANGLVTRGEGLGTLTLRSSQPGVTVPTLSTFGGINFPVTGGAVTLRSAALNVAGAFGPGDEGIVNVNNVTFTQMSAVTDGMLRAAFTGDVDPTWANITFDSPLDGPYYFRFEPFGGPPYDGQTITFVNATPAVECLVGVCLPGDPVVPSGGFSTATWDGSTDANWNEPTNWSTGLVPTATTQVTIPAGPPQPVLDANAQVASLTVDASATLTVGAGDTLTVWGDIVANGTVGGLDDESVVWMRPTTLASLSGAVEEWNATLLVGAGLGGAGGVQMASNFTLSGGPNRGLYIFDGNFDVFGYGLTVNGTLATGGNGRLVMNTANPLVEIGGDAIFSGASTEGWLSEGRLRVSGSLFQGGTSTTSFASTVNHVLEFFGPDASSLVFTSPGTADSRIASLELSKAVGIELDLVASNAYIANVLMLEGVFFVDNFTLFVTNNFANTQGSSFVSIGTAGAVTITGTCNSNGINATGPDTLTPNSCRAP
jgi:hypothetical protein